MKKNVVDSDHTPTRRCIRFLHCSQRWGLSFGEQMTEQDTANKLNQMNGIIYTLLLLRDELSEEFVKEKKL